MKYHSAPLIPHKSALMSAPANLLAEEVCLPAALLKKSALENNISWMQRYADAMDISGAAASGGVGDRRGQRLAG